MAIVIRLAAITMLLVGPWTDDVSELSGWDAERFQEIADRDTAAWVEQPIEYPPGSVVVFDLLAGDDVVDTNRAIIVVSAIAELAGTALVWRAFGSRTAKAFTILGLPLVPMGYLRLDLLVTVIAAVAAVALLRTVQARAKGRESTIGHTALTPRSTGLFAVLVVVGAMIKIWPALLIIGAVGIGRRGAALAAAALGGVAGLTWLAVVGAGFEPLDQVLSLRGATGWHLESLPGALIALTGDGEPRLELNAFRIGTINDLAVTIGRAVAVVVTVALAVSALTGNANAKPDSNANPNVNPNAPTGDRVTQRRFALVMLGSVAALMITAPLLSPQFLLWLTPWAALLLTGDAPKRRSTNDYPVVLVAAAITLTGFTLTVFGPANLADTVPAALLTVRNLALLATPVACLIALRSEVRSEFGEG